MLTDDDVKKIKLIPGTTLGCTPGCKANTSSMDKELEVLSLEQALKILPGFTTWGLRNMVRRKQIPYHKRSKRILFLRSELVKWAENLPGVTVEEALTKDTSSY